MVADIANTRLAIAIDKETDALQLLADRVFAARKQVDGQILAYLAKTEGATSSDVAAKNDSLAAGWRAPKHSGSFMKASTTAGSGLNQSKGVRAGANGAFRMLSVAGGADFR
jgi:hypothetical protein